MSITKHKQILLVCNYCGHKQYVEKEPKKCPRCHNKYGNEPVYKKVKKEVGNFIGRNKNFIMFFLGIFLFMSIAYATTISDTTSTFNGNVNYDSNLTLSSSTISLTNPYATNALFIDQNANGGTSTSTGGALRLDMTGSDGAGLLIYSNNGASASGRLLNIRADNSSFNQAAFHIDYDGTANAAEVSYVNNDSSGQALNVVSYNELDSPLGVNGQTTGKGVVKIVHLQPSSSDANAAAISIDLQGATTASKGIFIDTTTGNTTGHLLDLRNGGSQRFVVTSEGVMQLLANRTAITCGTSQAGYIYYDGTLSKHYGCNGTTWNALY
ncbi:MAG TPA: hypothetical protein VHA12_00175 [Candidatus Nanoarchaeia archaeon]|nr:hypothetical protein [Candidatus Nanoarchaeia archaeon]